MSMPVEMIMEQGSVAVGQWPDDERTLADSGFCWRERSGVKVLVCTALEAAGFANGFSTRLGGVSAIPENSLNLAGYNDDSEELIAENRRRFLNVVGDEFLLATVWQEHGDRIKLVKDDQDIPENDDKADAVASAMDGILAAVKTADCVPILIGDTATRSFAAAHAGWRGTALSIAKKAVKMLMREFGATPENMITAIGPAACGRNYEIGEDVMTAFREAFGDDVMRYFSPTRPGHALVDLHAVNRDQLIAAGIPDTAIFTAPYCTMERDDIFFSYRKDRPKYGKTGRLLSVIGRSPSA
ncbi:MAG: peptidoglycan editing factor PgeF [Acidobacteriota bacterium]|nr:MAG: peptidoglycan editing factor PgeF [Acidobacteriota bacterium]